MAYTAAAEGNVCSWGSGWSQCPVSQHLHTQHFCFVLGTANTAFGVVCSDSPFLVLPLLPGRSLQRNPAPLGMQHVRCFILAA